MTPHPYVSVRARPACRIVAVALAAVGLVSCNGTTSPDLDDQASGELAAAVSTAVSRGFAVALNDGGRMEGSRAAAGRASGGETPPLALASRSWSFDSTGECPAGGTATSRGDGTVESTEREGGGHDIAWSWQSTLSYFSCGVFTDDHTFFFTTESPLQFTGDGQVVTDGSRVTQGSFDWSYSGTVEWVKQGEGSGTCSVDMSTTVTFQGSTAQGSWTGVLQGTVCGRAVDRSWATTIQP